MDELVEIVIWILVALVKVIAAIVRGFFRLLIGISRRLGAPAQRQASRTSEPARLSAPAAHKLAAPAAPTRLAESIVAALVARGTELVTTARALGKLADDRAATRRFTDTLAALATRGEALITRIRRADGTHASFDRELGREETMLAILDAMVSERRGPLVELLGDTDALAGASYAPIVEFCARRAIPLSSDRAATIVGGDKLFFLSVDEPTGLAAIVLPESFTSELMTWPAIAHEIAHDFFHSVSGLPAELRRAAGLGTELRLPPAPQGSNQRSVDLFVAQIAARATSAWMEELFADAFGTMMLGPAYIETMSESFASPDEPGRALAMMTDEEHGAPRYEEHPPGHVRVVLACRLLGRMGHGKEADRLEAAWRARHGEPELVYAPMIGGRWLAIPEGPVLDRAELVGRALYLTGLACLRGQPLRSIAGLDFGPRESEQAKRIAEKFSSLRPVRTGDPRLLVAGAVLATVAHPGRASAIYALAREAIVGVDAPTRATQAGVETELQGPLGPIDATALREALILGELLAAPSARR